MENNIWLLLALLVFACAGSPTMYGEITYHHEPQGYPSNAQELWEITVPKGFGINLYFIHMDIEPSENCEHDSVKVIIGDEVKENLCGISTFWSSGQNKYFSTNVLRINFTSDTLNTEQYTGFSLTFSAVDLNECEDPAQNNCSHFCSNYIGGYFCSCRPGYLLLPDKHTCAVVDCGPPTNIDDGLVIFNQTTHRSEATYSCASEYYTPASGDGTFRCPSNGLWANKDGGQELPRCVPVCGIFKQSQTPRGRILGGQIAEPGQFPWQIAFVSPSRGCGALISDRWILTAAHIVQDKESPEMYGGVINLRPKKQENLLKAKKIIVHPSWITQENEDRVSYNHDIALILLCSKVKLGPLISPICLPGSDHGMSPTLYQRAYIAGWGATEKKERTVNLLFTTVSLSKIEKCQELDKEEKYIFTSNMLCAGDANGHDSCKGDDGGPLMVFQDGRMYIAGITSWGVNCGKFGVYTKVENYMDWIKETMERVEMEEDGSPDPECA